MLKQNSVEGFSENIQPKIEGEETSLEANKEKETSVSVDIVRHSKKEKADKPDNEILLSPEGREMAQKRGELFESEKEELSRHHKTKSGRASPKIRTSDTVYRLMYPEAIDVNASKEDIEKMIAKEVKVGKQVVEDERLDFTLDGPEGKEMLDAFKAGQYLQYMVEKSDRRAIELGDETSSTYSRYAGNIAELVARYSKIGDNFNRIVSEDDKKAAKFEKLGNRLERYLVSHQGVVEGFVAKLLEKTQGDEKRDEFINSLGGGFKELQGIHVEILNKGAEQKIQISYDIGDKKEKIEIEPKLVEDIIQERGEFEKKVEESREAEKSKETENLNYVIRRTHEMGSELNVLYKDFHENPELGGEEVETAKKVEKYLQGLGIEIVGSRIGIGPKIEGTDKRQPGCSLVARIAGKVDGPTIALRADMDALPVQENKENNPRSKKDGLMHGCGHDTHTTGLLGAAKILKEMADKKVLPGNILLMFQSSEEKSHQKESGSVQIVKFLEENNLREKINAFLGLHIYGGAERGQVQFRKEGVSSASSGEIDITLKAPGGHIINVYNEPSLQRVFSKITLRLEEAFRPLEKNKEALVGSARTIYEGAGYNVLPSEAKSTWVVRVASPEYKTKSKEIIQKIREAVNEVIKEEMGGEKIKCEIEQRPGYRPIIHRDQGLTKATDEAVKEVIPNCVTKDELMLGGEDFSFYLEEFRGKQIPGVFAMIGGANSEKGYPKTPHHNPKFKIDPETIEDLAATYTNLSLKAMKYFKNKV